mmetsp:Transcript_60792/g.113673  ORF Transcript_60792/g.113673 Transcript_60792/m.113673 type:complete len:245 (-) Transcript_60792:52-786(-)
MVAAWRLPQARRVHNLTMDQQGRAGNEVPQVADGKLLGGVGIAVHLRSARGDGPDQRRFAHVWRAHKDHRGLVQVDAWRLEDRPLTADELLEHGLPVRDHVKHLLNALIGDEGGQSASFSLQACRGPVGAHFVDLSPQVLQASQSLAEGHASLVPVLGEGQFDSKSLERVELPDQARVLQNLPQAPVDEIPHELHSVRAIDPVPLPDVHDVMLDLHLLPCSNLLPNLVHHVDCRGQLLNLLDLR